MNRKNNLITIVVIVLSLIFNLYFNESVFSLENKIPDVDISKYPESVIIDYKDGIFYGLSPYYIFAIKDDETIWENKFRVWEDPNSEDDTKIFEVHKPTFLFSLSNEYLFVRSVYFKGCCIYYDYTIKIVSRKTGETVHDVKGLSMTSRFFCNNDMLFYTTGLDNETKTERWRREYDEQNNTNTLHMMDTNTFTDIWTCHSDNANYIIEGPKQLFNNKLYLLLYNDCAFDKHPIHNRIRCIDIETGDIIATYIFEGDVRSFRFVDNSLIVNLTNRIFCFSLPEKDELEQIIHQKNSNIIVYYVVNSYSYSYCNVTNLMNVAPVIQNGRTLLPARFVTEPLGGDVSWDGTEKKVVCALGETIVELWIGKSTAKVNGTEVQIDPDNSNVVPTIINDRTMVPIRFLAESLGCEVEWIADTKEIILTYTP